MKRILALSLFLGALVSCHRPPKALVGSVFIDSLISHYTSSPAMVGADSNFSFWKRRMDQMPDNFVNGPELAGALNSRFRLYGNIEDLLEADSLYEECSLANQGQEPGIYRTLASLAIMQHQFVKADSFLQKAVAIEGRSVPNVFLEFDVSFELGQITRARHLLPSLKNGNLFGYEFRRSKLEHYIGSLDTAINCMLVAGDKAGNNNSLKQIAWSNAADLCIHKGDMEQANSLYMQSIRTDAADMHSIMSLGWIALVHDKNDTLAEKIFHFVQSKYQAPDLLLKLEQAAELRNDTAVQLKYAREFESKVSQPAYGAMYSKYLIDLYTGILAEPAKAVALAEKEITSRPTPQVYAWYSWSLFCNNQPDKAYSTFKQHVSGKPLEGPELYYMGKLMQGMGKGYDAQQFFEAAHTNQFDLSPAKERDLEKVEE